ncbi:EpsD family peptidyl-prolyl cis-trans isomerase [Allopontixanthobacter sediminis]|uniref:Peptidyl-prolyl cis-trans isomerase, EpsD family n=1 Tax=Allopontixanthobacter sediminis TaxID=1689985 RepID=A0A845BAJ4_9SPHN|nr:peptidyl-prolyl cis-trans isomerase, EpsD family [Allopontixanthobacter sediminis]
MTFTFTARLALASAVLISLTACSSEPTGQVVAVVNGEEITQQELNAEISELPAPPVGDKEAIRRQVLQQIVDRRLISQVAKEDGLDKDPMYITRQRRLNEELLVQMYGTKIADTVRVPDAASIKKYLADNPGKFSQRTAYLVDQISFDLPNDPSVLKALEADKSMADVEQTLKRFNVSYDTGKNTIDSMSIPTPALNQILALPPGEPFVVPTQGKIVVSVITGRQAVPTSEEDATPVAAQTMRAENLGKVLQTRLDEARTKATITYQEGLAPAPKKTPTK